MRVQFDRILSLHGSETEQLEARVSRNVNAVSARLLKENGCCKAPRDEVMRVSF